jgi:hypothetical protein
LSFSQWLKPSGKIGLPILPKRKFLKTTIFSDALSSTFRKKIYLFSLGFAHGITPYAALPSLYPYGVRPFKE